MPFVNHTGKFSTVPATFAGVLLALKIPMVNTTAKVITTLTMVEMMFCFINFNESDLMITN